MPRPKEYDRADHLAHIAEYVLDGFTEADFERDNTMVCDCHGIRWINGDTEFNRETGRVTCWDAVTPYTAEDAADDAWKEGGL